MKKLYLLLFMFSIFALPNITTHGFEFNTTDYEVVAGTTLTDMFETNNLILTGDMESSTGWSGSGVISGGVNTITANGTFVNSRYTTSYISVAGHKIYYVVEVKSINLVGNQNFYVDGLSGANLTTTNLVLGSNIGFLSSIGTARTYTNPTIDFYVQPSTTSGTIVFDNAYAINLSTIFGVGTEPTRFQVDIYYRDYQQYKSYELGLVSTTAYSEGYDVGFGEGYDTGVAEDNAYAIGYSKGLVDGGDMETGSSILIFVVAAIGFIMMIFGFTTRRGIFNLLSVGAFVVLGAMLAQYIGFIIIAIGLVIINVYYAFWGDL